MARHLSCAGGELMSHIFEALRKSEQKENGDLLSPEAFLYTLENTPDLASVTSENAELQPESRLVVWDNPRALAADRYRLLRMNLEKLRGGRKLRTLLLTSPSPQDGKSTVTLNLATILADRGKHKVLIIEADLRCPSLSRRLGLRRWEGLSGCLEHGLEPISAVRLIQPMEFYLLPAGKLVANPTELLQSERLTQIVQSMSNRFDWILIDAPPTSPIADTLALKSRADACLLVVRSGKTPREAVEEAIRQFGQAFVAGIVLNALESLDGEYSEYYSKYYGDAGAEKPEAAGNPSK
jgi:capsular exopolysaccharide synthesis family protein